MIKYMTKYSAEDLLQQLREKELITVDKKEQLSKTVISTQLEEELPLYLRFLLAIGASIASVLLVSFLGISGLIHESVASLIIWGLIFTTGAICLHVFSYRENDSPVINSLILQFSFTFISIGKIFFVVGTVILLESSWGISLALLLVTIATYPIYRMSIDRFLSTFILLCSILVNTLQTLFTVDLIYLLLNSLFLVQFFASALFLTCHKIRREYIPLGYAFVFSLCVNVLCLSFFMIMMQGEDLDINIMFINIPLSMSLALGLIGIFIWVSGGIKKIKYSTLAFVSVLAILLSLISAPGILSAISLIVLGYLKHENVLRVLGLLILPVFLILYYYNLDVSLMQKSLILMGSGLVLLLGRLYLKHKQWDKGISYA